MINEKKSSYSSIIAIACCLIVFGGVGIVFSTAGVFYAVVAESFGVGKGTFSIYMTIVCLVMSFSLPFLGKMVAKTDIRKVMTLCGACVAISFAMFAIAPNLIVIYVAAVIQGFGVAGPMYIVVPTMINRWFNKRAGFFIGLAMAFSGIAGIVLQPGMAAIIAATSWRTAYWVEAAISGAFIILPSILMLRSYPSDKGQVPYGFEEAAEGAAAAANNPVSAGVALKVAMKSKAFYFLAIVCGAISFITCVNFYWTSYATSLGYDLVIAASISSAAMWGQLAGKIGLGWLSDKSYKTAIICSYGFGIISMGAALIFGAGLGVTMLLVFIFMYGMCHGSCAVISPVISRKCFGNGKDSATIYSNAMSFGTFCSAMTYKKIMSVLAHAKKVRYGEDGWQLVRLNPSHEEILQVLGLIPRPEEAPKKKPGRPKKNEGKPASKESEGDLANGKRRRGRPKGSRNRPKTDAGATGAS